jgi:PAS domain S-box-containing protein
MPALQSTADTFTESGLDCCGPTPSPLVASILAPNHPHEEAAVSSQPESAPPLSDSLFPHGEDKATRCGLPASDLDALLGLLAVRTNLLAPEALSAAVEESAKDGCRSLEQFLVSRGLLQAKEAAALKVLAEGQLARHGNDCAKTLATRHGPETGTPLASRDVGPNAGEAPGTRDVARPSRYRVVQPHARGGLGEVFVAVDEEFGREVALKEIQGRYADDPLCRARFLREAEVTGRLEHPGIVPVYGLGAYPDGRPYYAMRFIKGASLRCAIGRLHSDEELRADGKKWSLELRKLLGRFLAVCNAVDYAHSKGVIHRDLKPDNVMLGDYGETYVVDWGLARVVSTQEEDGPGNRKALRFTGEAQNSDITRMGEVLGTPAYMSPEQAQGEVNRLGPASDVYSLGALLYHLLTGKAPFEGRDVQVLIGRVCKGEFLPPREVSQTVPTELEAIILKAMALKAEDRYPSAGALAAEVERWLADDPLSGFQHANLFTTAPDGTVTSLSPAFEKLYGWSRAEILGKAFAPYIHPEDLPSVMAIHQRAFEGGETPPVFTCRFLTKAGKYVTSEVMSILDVREGKVVGAFSISRVVS